MLGNEDAVANVAVKNLDVASKFYTNTLGLKQVHNQEGELIVFKSGTSSINVYRSKFAGTNQATAVTWTVNDLEATVKELKAKGVTFEHYDMPGLKIEGDVPSLRARARGRALRPQKRRASRSRSRPSFP